MNHFEIDRDLKELTKHRTVDLPLACYETTINQNIHGHIPLHWHEEIQFVRMIKGEAVFKINGASISIREGDGLFINSGCLHSAEDFYPSNGTYICLNVSPHFVLNPELYTTYVDPYLRATNLPFLHLEAKEPWAKNILEAILQIKQFIQQQSPFFEIETTVQLTLIWQNLMVNGFHLEYDPLKVQKDQRMKQMLNWIHQHYTEKVLLEDIAKAGQLSRSECCRYFKRILKTTPLNYVTNYRIRRSSVLLKQTDASVTEVSYQVGFNSTSYFIDQFKKVMGRTPLDYKKSN
ncbi:AraC family transcriptional regulator [Pullulanibacillus sp. KACC 23026]|uniref:helix-turn-helix transcriptional regulator n=1 Tax=Pullulanibacillus sp. KACC 23026 TaxID=3028315 RepID=UPI0023AEC0D4|nr:AraC family transcriptional regulator [Pullulanibacillus sp. KACC 23026]WEG13271.1 AraC family transcriptional regulator [Pullulanibacillus sp. KACC 23026]